MNFKVLVVLLLISLVYQETVTIFGNSLVTFVFLLMIIRISFLKGDVGLSILRSGFFINSVFFILYIAVVELSHPLTDLGEVNRAGQTIAGAFILYLNINRKSDFLFLLNGFIILSLVYSLVLIYNGYENILGSHTDESWDYLAQAFGAIRNTNDIGFVIASGTSILVIRLVDYLKIRSNKARGASFLILLFFVGLFIIGKRSGFLMATLVPIMVLIRYRRLSLKTLVLFLLIPVLLLSIKENAIVSRSFQYFEGTDIEDTDGRGRVFVAAIENIPKVFEFGVGAGNYYNNWGTYTGFYFQRFRDGEFHGRVMGAHNLYFQLILFWGIGALVLFIALIYRLYSMLPKGRQYVQIRTILYALFVCLVFNLFLTHVFATKEFSIVIALILAYGYKLKVMSY